MSVFLHNLADPFYRAFALLGIFILLFGLVSLFVKERLYLTESLVAVLFGIIIGPFALGILTPQDWFDAVVFDRMLMEFSRIIISFQVMAVGLCTPLYVAPSLYALPSPYRLVFLIFSDYVRKEWPSIAMLLGPCMVFMWLVASLAVYVSLGFSWWESMMIGACLAPTDPILANGVIKGKFANRYIPSHLRNLLAVESGANDGLGFPFLMLPIFMSIHQGAVGGALLDWLLQTLLYEIGLSILIGLVLGFGARLLLEKSEKYKLIDKESFLVYAIALAMAISGLVALISSDDLLSVFIAGNVFSYDDKFHQATKDAHFQEVLDQLFNITFFVYLGTIIPWGQFLALGLGRLFLSAALILLFRRLPFIMAARRLIPQIRSNKEAFFVGWFGPMGVGGIFFSMLCRQNEALSDTVRANVFTVVTFIVLASIVIHGITVPFTHISLKTKARRKLKRQQQQHKLVGVPGYDDLDTQLGREVVDRHQQHHYHHHHHRHDMDGQGHGSGDEEDDGMVTESESPTELVGSLSPYDAASSFISTPKLESIMVAATEGETGLSFHDLDLLRRNLQEKLYEQDPYAETLDLRGLDPEKALAKLYQHFKSATTTAVATSTLGPTGGGVSTASTIPASATGIRRRDSNATGTASFPEDLLAIQPLDSTSMSRSSDSF